MAQVIIKKHSLRKNLESSVAAQSDEVIVTGDQVVINSDKSITVTFTESDIIVDLAE